MPFSVISTASGEWIFGQSIEQKYGVCKFVGFMLWYGALLVTATLAIVSFDQFPSIVKPFIHKQYMTTYSSNHYSYCLDYISCIEHYSILWIWYIFIWFRSRNMYSKLVRTSTLYLSFFVVIFLIMIVTIVVTSIWTCCFTRRFLEQHQSGSNIDLYVNKNRKKIGSLMLVYALCFGPALITATITIIIYIIHTIYICHFNILFLLHHSS